MIFSFFYFLVNQEKKEFHGCMVSPSSEQRTIKADRGNSERWLIGSFVRNRWLCINSLIYDRREEWSGTDGFRWMDG